MSTFGVKDIAKRFATGEHTVLGWIRRGELKAINCGRQVGRRPKWRVTPEALLAFEQFRSNSPPVTSPVRRTKAAKPANYIQYV